MTEYVENGENGTEAALAAYDTDDRQNAANIASQNLKNPTVASKIEIALEKKGVTLDKVAERINESLDATKWAYDRESADYLKTEAPDFGARQKGIDTVVKIVGANAPKKTQIEFQGVLAVGDIEEIRKALQG